MNRKVYGITELNQAIRSLLEENFTLLWVEGEISNLKSYPSGHIYFSLKDEESQIRAVLFRGNARKLPFELQDGLQVLVRAGLSAYVKRGEVQLIVQSVEPKAKGALQLALEQLKEKLKKEGLFAPERKRKIPFLPQRIGIVTSTEGAALRDILQILDRRFQNLEILICPVRVQGDSAKFEITRAIQELNRFHPQPDVLLVGRGGGSLEDLWAFNEETVVRAIAASRIPIVSCVGHETDFTLADLAADLRAPTPSAAAELVVQSKQELQSRIHSLSQRLRIPLRHLLQSLGDRLRLLWKSRALQKPSDLVLQKSQELDESLLRLQETLRQKILLLEKDFKMHLARLHALSPTGILSRGYSIAFQLPERKVLKRAQDAEVSNPIELLLYQGRLLCEVKERFL